MNTVEAEHTANASPSATRLLEAMATSSGLPQGVENVTTAPHLRDVMDVSMSNLQMAAQGNGLLQNMTFTEQSLSFLDSTDLPGMNWDNVSAGTAEDRYYPTVKQETPTVIIYTLTYVAIFLCALVGNTLVVLVVAKTPRMRNVTNYFIANLAVADIIVAIVCIPITLLSNIYNGWPYGEFLCKTTPYLQGVSVCASVFTLSAIAVDRYLAICLHPNWRITKQTSRAVVVSIWLAAFAFPVPWAVFYQHYPFGDTGFMICHQIWPNYDAQRIFFVVVNFLIFYLMPLTVVLVCYIFIARRVWTRHAPGVAHDNTLIRKSRIKVVKMLAVMVVLFALSWLPIHALYFTMYFGHVDMNDSTFFNIYIPLAHWLELSNSGINPIIYCFFSRNFRRGFKTLLHCSSSCGERSSTAVHSSTTKYMTIEYVNGHVTISFKKDKVEESSSTV